MSLKTHIATEYARSKGMFSFAIGALAVAIIFSNVTVSDAASVEYHLLPNGTLLINGPENNDSLYVYLEEVTNES